MLVDKRRESVGQAIPVYFPEAWLAGAAAMINRIIASETKSSPGGSIRTRWTPAIPQGGVAPVPRLP